MRKLFNKRRGFGGLVRLAVCGILAGGGGFASAQNISDAPPGGKVPRVTPPPVTPAPGANAPDAQTGTATPPAAGASAGRTRSRGSTSTQGLGTDLNRRTGVENRQQLAPAPGSDLPELTTTPDPLAPEGDSAVLPAATPPTLNTSWPALRFGMNLTASREGLVLGSVAENSLAGQAGFIQGDVITSVDQSPILSESNLVTFLNQHRAGDKLTFNVAREGLPTKLTMMLPATFRPATGDRQSRAALKPPQPSLASIDPQTLSPVNLGWNLRETPEGVLVVSVSEGDTAAAGGLQAGDLFDMIDSVSVTTIAEVNYEFQKHRGGSSVPVTVMRDAQRQPLTVKLPREFAGDLADDSDVKPDFTVSQDQADLQTLIEEVRQLRAEVSALKAAQGNAETK